MPIEFGVGEALELLKFGKFTLLSIRGTIAAADAVPITRTPMVGLPTVEAVYDIQDDWRVITERFCWGTDVGGTSIPDKVYYELFNDPGEIEVPSWCQGFYCGSKIRYSNLDNVCTHIFSGGRIHVKLWNCSSPAEDVTFDFTVWYYTYHSKHHDDVMRILLKTPNTLQEILEAVKKRG